MRKNNNFQPIKIKATIKNEWIQLQITFPTGLIWQSIRKTYKNNPIKILFKDWEEVERWRETPYNIQSIIKKFIEPYLLTVFHESETYHDAWHCLCIDVGKAIYKAYQEHRTIN